MAIGEGVVVFTVGHGTKPATEFLGMLEGTGVRRLVDVRTAPGSRVNPQYGRDELARSLPDAGIAYEWRRDLGGWRKAAPTTSNTALRSAGLRGYADYMETAEFAVALDRLVDTARRETSAVMCAETLWWRCHRGILADALTVAGCEVRHIMPGKIQPHRLHPALRVEGHRLIYDVESPSLAKRSTASSKASSGSSSASSAPISAS